MFCNIQFSTFALIFSSFITLEVAEYRLLLKHDEFDMHASSETDPAVVSDCMGTYNGYLICKLMSQEEKNG